MQTPSNEPIYETVTGSYDRIAGAYLSRWSDRRAIADLVERFASLLISQGLGHAPVVDVGCGPGFDAALLQAAGLRVVGLDRSMGMIKAGRGRYAVNFVQADMRRLPLAPVIGGLWVCASLLHLTRPDVPASLKGLARSLVPGGILCLTVKQGDGQEWQVASFGRLAPRYFTYWQPTQLDPLLEAAGLEIVEASSTQLETGTTWLVRLVRRRSAASP